ncbi:MAG: NUDIX hydrolase [Candidatus Korarchaeota archaeon]|nr:NUDIX hydrolase [Candidatus Korarchaeota archaeon]NIU82902.1 NUDIX domain-containing protein [Candidatus Thorarchaeota archaeon]NIW14751.1 NUDIX domain-containing protein [Candidatus Thorarchaeota archaeon]NIW52822.1 NUDIX domain-containing protein [Candidatus Korarchaeota archaeon]
MKRKTPYLAVDSVIIENDRVALIKRKNPPFQGSFALPGGFVEWGESVRDACKREAREETGLTIEIVELLDVFSDPDRDPRGHVCSVVFLAKRLQGKLVAASDASDVQWIPISKIKDAKIPLAFDHEKILKVALEKMLQGC